MIYDRQGRPASKPDEAAVLATPNAARLAAAGRRGSAAGPKAAAAPAATPVTRRARSGFAPRLLPLTAFVAALVLSVKVGTIWEHGYDAPAAFAVDTASTVSLGAPALAGPDPRSEPVIIMAQAATGTTADGRVDPFALGKSQIELLQSLSERREALDARERAIEQREGLLIAAEHRIESKIGELKAVRAEIESLIKKYDEQEEQQIAGLVKIYETMKPKDAARIFNELDMEVLLEVFGRMKSSKTAPVLADMDPLRAKEITMRIAERHRMPDIN
jgi:flagellar motility protein MotE (MotC chaperone)